MVLRTVVMAADTLWIAVFLALVMMQGATRSAFFCLRRDRYWELLMVAT